MVENNDYSEDAFYGGRGLSPDIIGIITHRPYTPEHNDKKQNDDYIHRFSAQGIFKIVVDIFSNSPAIFGFKISVKERIPRIFQIIPVSQNHILYEMFSILR